MFEVLLNYFPKSIVIEIVLFEGRVTNAYLQQYVSQIYAGVYKKYFGYRHNLSYVTKNRCSLGFYAAWSALIRKQCPTALKSRIPRSYMRPFGEFIPTVRLEKERLRMAAKLKKYFHPKTDMYVMWDSTS